LAPWIAHELEAGLAMQRTATDVRAVVAELAVAELEAAQVADRSGYLARDESRCCDCGFRNEFLAL
jgi:hypothetical protein